MVDHALSLGCDPLCVVGHGRVPSADVARELCRVACELEKKNTDGSIDREKGKERDEKGEGKGWEVVKLLCECEAVLDEWAVTYVSFILKMFIYFNLI